MMTDANPSVSLVLGSGGARGLAHIGVINWLEANGYVIQSIAGNLGGPVAENDPLPDSFPVAASEDMPMREKIARFIDKLKQPVAGSDDEAADVSDIANQAFDAMQSTIARLKLAAYPPDILIEIPRNACGTLEFDRADEMITLGYQKAKESALRSAPTSDDPMKHSQAAASVRPHSDE